MNSEEAMLSDLKVGDTVYVAECGQIIETKVLEIVRADDGEEWFVDTKYGSLWFAGDEDWGTCPRQLAEWLIEGLQNDLNDHEDAAAEARQLIEEAKEFLK
jgi:hypothetical protein